ncbi:TPR-like protein [Anaeromyces robustus]|uniref:TPR-like protein n=1 Tax=Anaeromyces robustus TaxID=1754192 RepID=A0A1Y1XAP6_9FUNG|nr:TPR-like protein [Anaeromyces robustus]|eukprot:ORX82822.1 TPR-like protein [Anaeromyces robustus]
MITNLNTQEAENYIKDAEKLKKSWFYRNSKLLKAAELYKKAGLIYKLSKKWMEAGDAYFRAATCYNKQNPIEAITLYIDSSNCYRDYSSSDAIYALNNAVELCKENGRFRKAAKHQIAIGEIYESNLNDIHSAIAAYETAIELLNNEMDETKQLECYEKIAIFYSELEQYEKTIDIFFKISKISEKLNKSWYSTNNYILNAGLCQLYQNLRDNVLPNKLMNILNICIRFNNDFKDSDEYRFLKNLIFSVEKKDPEYFVQILQDFDKRSPFDTWRLKLLLQIKQFINMKILC